MNTGKSNLKHMQQPNEFRLSCMAGLGPLEHKAIFRIPDAGCRINQKRNGILPSQN